MNTQDKVVIVTRDAAYVGTVTKAYKDESVAVLYGDGQMKRFTRNGTPYGESGRSSHRHTVSMMWERQEDVEGRVTEINVRQAARMEEKEQEFKRNEQERQQRIAAAKVIVDATEKMTVETVVGPLTIYNVGIDTYEGKIALVVKCTGEVGVNWGGSQEYYYSIAVAAERSFGATSVTATTMEDAVIEYVSHHLR